MREVQSMLVRNESPEDRAMPADLGEQGRLTPLYRLHFSYARAWSVHLGGVHGGAGASYAVAYGSCSGHIEGEFAGENRPEHGEDGSTIPDFTGIISTCVTPRSTRWSRWAMAPSKVPSAENVPMCSS